MAVRVVTDSTVEAVSVSDLRDWLRIDGPDDDALLGRLSTAARQYCETFTGRAFVSKSLKLTVDRLTTEIRLPLPPAIAVQSVKYYDADNAQQTLSSAYYTLDTETEPARLVQAYNQSYPSVLDRVNAVEVNYTAGYGTTAAAVPRSLRQAIQFLVAHWYENREAVAFGVTVTQIPFAIESLLWQYRIVEVS